MEKYSEAWNLFAVRMAEALTDPKESDASDLEPLWDALSLEEQERFLDMLKRVKGSSSK